MSRDPLEGATELDFNQAPTQDGPSSDPLAEASPVTLGSTQRDVQSQYKSSSERLRKVLLGAVYNFTVAPFQQAGELLSGPPPSQIPSDMTPDEIAAFKESGRASTTPLEAILSDKRYTDAEKIALMSPLTNLGLIGALGQRSVGGVKLGPGTGFRRKITPPVEPPPPPPVDPLTQDYFQLRGLFDVVEQTGKRPKPDKTFRKISNVPSLEQQVQIANDTAARQAIGEMSQVATPSPVESLQREAALSLPPPLKKLPPRMPKGPVTAELTPPSAEAMLIEQQRRAAQLGVQGPGTPKAPTQVTGPNIPIEFAGPTAEAQAISALQDQAQLGVQRLPTELHAGLKPPEGVKEALRKGGTNLARLITGEPPLPIAPVEYSGYQEGFGRVPGFHMYTLKEGLSPDLVKGSTVSETTLHQAGYRIPPELGMASRPGKIDIPTDTQLHAGLPVPESIKEPIRKFFGRLTGSTVGKAVTEAAQPPESTAHFYNAREAIFNRAFPPAPDGVGLGTKLMEARGWEDAYKGRGVNAIESTPLMKLNRNELLSALRVGENRESKPLNSRVAQVVEWWKVQRAEHDAFLKEYKGQVYVPAVYEGTTSGARLREPQWKPYTTVKDFVPQAIDWAEVVKLSDKDLGGLLAKSNPRLTPAEAGELGVGMRAQAAGRQIPATVGDKAARILRKELAVSPHLVERSGLVIPDEIRVLNPYPEYLANMAREKAVLRVFGPKDALMESTIKGLQLRPRVDSSLAVAEWDAYRGRNIPEPTYKSIAQVERIFTNAATTTLLGPQTALKQYSQVGIAFHELPLKAFVRGTLDAFTKKGKFDAAEFGASVMDLQHDLVMPSEGARPALTMLDRLDKLTAATATKVVEGMQISAADRFGRVLTWNGAKRWFSDLQVKANRGSVSALTKLKEEGLTPTSSYEEVGLAATRVANRVNLRTGPEVLPAFLYKPGFGFARALNGFNIGMSKKLAFEYIAPLVKAVGSRDVRATTSALKRIVGLTTTMAVSGEVLGTTLKTLVGRSDDRPGGSLTDFATDLIDGNVPASIIVSRIMDDLLFSGMFGYLQVVKEGIAASSGPAESVARATGALVGAGISNAAELAAQTANVVIKGGKSLLAEPRDVKKADQAFSKAAENAGRAYARRIPGAGLVVSSVIPGRENKDRERATNGYIQAMNRKDIPRAMEWKAWFREQHGKNLDPDALNKARREYNQ